MVAGPVNWSVPIIIGVCLVPEEGRSRLIKTIALERSDCPWIQLAIFARDGANRYASSTAAIRP
jgi:hypothetical protein